MLFMATDAYTINKYMQVKSSSFWKKKYIILEWLNIGNVECTVMFYISRWKDTKIHSNFNRELSANLKNIPNKNIKKSSLVW